MLFLPIETKVREYHGKLLFSLVAAEQGFQILLGGQRNIRNTVHLYKRGVYIDKSIAPTKKKWMSWCKRLGLNVAAWDEEGLVYFDDTVYHDLRVSEDILKQTSLFFAWGEAQRQAIISKIPREKKKIIVVGNPRFDMLRPEIREFYEPAVTKLKKQYGAILLINTNFGFCNHYHGVETERQRLQVYPIAMKRPGFFEGWIAAQEKIYPHFKTMIPRLRESFPDHTIIIRPHPSENHDTWKKIIGNLPRCLVSGKGNVLEWISASDVLIHFNCTTAIEAYLLGVPAIAYQAEPLGEYEQKLPNALSLKAENLNELIELVTDSINSGFDDFFLHDDQARTEIAHQFIGSLDGLLASERIVQALYDRKVIPDTRRSFFQQLFRIERSLWLSAKRLRNLGGGVNTYDRQKFSGLIKGEIEADIMRFQAVTKKFNDIKVRSVKHSCFIVEKG